MSFPAENSVRSALFIDFDNIYFCLKKQNEAAADAFAKKPAQWFTWLQQSRRIHIRRCYMTPSFSQFRSAFDKAGFEVIECPRLTSSSKNSADIRMTVDILMDYLEHKIPITEFILFSSDADFSPVLRKLREHGRTTVILTVGESASAYKALGDQVLSQDKLVTYLLSLQTESASKPQLVAKPSKEDQTKRLADFLIKKYVKPMSQFH